MAPLAAATIAPGGRRMLGTNGRLWTVAGGHDGRGEADRAEAPSSVLKIQKIF
jgi:hypothetical protein